MICGNIFQAMKPKAMGGLHVITRRPWNQSGTATDRKKPIRYYCDKGGHWVVGLNVPVEPKKQRSKGGIKFRDCGRC